MSRSSNKDINNMKLFASLIFGCLFYQITIAQNFIGEIKYLISSISLGSQDTLTYFFDEDAIFISHPKSVVMLGGSLYEAYILSEKKIFTFDVRNNIWSDFFDNSSVVTTKIALDSLRVEILLGHSCSVYGFKTKFKNESLQSDVQHTLWVSEDFIFKFPKPWTLDNEIFANGTGKIALKSERFGTTSAGSYVRTHDSNITVISICPMLSEEYKEILANFQKWHGK